MMMMMYQETPSLSYTEMGQRLLAKVIYGHQTLREIQDR